MQEDGIVGRPELAEKTKKNELIGNIRSELEGAGMSSYVTGYSPVESRHELKG